MKILEDNAAQGKHVIAVTGDDGDAKNFRENFNLKPFEFHHELCGDARFDMDRVRALALRLPKATCFSGDTTIGQGWQRPGTGIENALNKLEHGESWIILKKVHEDVQYGSLLTQCLSEVEELVHRRLEPLIESRTMSLILSSPGQLTPYHIDGDCNFLFQIRGTKAFYVFDGRDRSILTELEEETFWSGDANSAKFREENQCKAWLYELRPGIGVHVPVIFPHWVKNDQAVSMSLSINFRFHSGSYAGVYRANHYLRKLGLRPRPVGKFKTGDAIKGRLFNGVWKVAKKLRSLKKG